MASFAIRRLTWAVMLFFTLTLCAYVLFFLLPANPIQIGRGQFAEGVDIRDAYEIEGPVYEEYAEFVWGVLHGSLGRSVTNRQEVLDIIGRAAPVTASVVLGGVVVWLLISLPLGILAALRPRSLLDRAGMLFVLVGVSAHPAWIGLILAYFFGITLGWTPFSGYCDFIDPPTGSTCGGPVQWAHHLILPWLTLALLFAALYTRMVRAYVAEALHEDYVRTARAKGAPESRVMRSHVLRNAFMPVVTMVGMDLGLAPFGGAVLIGGGVFVENVYGLPGLGQLVLSSLLRRDLPVIVGVIVVAMTAIVVFNLVADLVHARLDPRIRVSAPAAEAEGRGAPAEPRPAPVATPVP